MNLMPHAEIFATAAHGAIGQKRKYTGEDYIAHPRRVVVYHDLTPMARV
jgi:hypothetical protein